MQDDLLPKTITRSQFMSDGDLIVERLKYVEMMQCINELESEPDYCSDEE
jgi:hypothetical protein